MDWADQVPIAVALLNSVPYMGQPFHLPESITVEELNKIAKKGIADSGSAAGGLIRPLIGSFDVSDNNGGFLFCVALPGVEKNGKFKCDVQEDGTITIHGATSTGGKKVHSHNMMFDIHTQNLCPPGDFLVSFKLPAHVDPTTLEHVLGNGVLEGLSRRNRSNMDWADQAPIAVASLNSVPYTGPPFDTAKQNQPLNHPTMVFLDESTTMDDVNQTLYIGSKGLAVEGAAASDLFPLKCNVREDGTIAIDGATSASGKKVHSHYMMFDMHTQNLCPPGDFSVSFKLPAHVDPTTLEHILDNGALEGVIKKKQV
ncbi:uncharacterized protein LOC143629910 [Bidens hawaiensis]|uniref:uncharacterized protein LOC143629910 n=1 Tax=Bidens hawaiensis TaxID=980011 RepID=UPI00404A716E